MPRRAMTGNIRPYQYTTDRGQKRWRARVDIGTSADGKRRRKTVTARTYGEAQRKVTQLLEEIRTTGAPVNRNIRLGEYAAGWLEQRAHDVDPKTYTGYRTMITKHCADWAGTPIAQITPSVVQQIISSAKAYDQRGRVKGAASVSARKQLRTVLNQVMQAALANGLILSNPVAAVRPPRKKDDMTAERGAFSVPELKEILRVASSMPVEQGAVWWWRFLTGMRQGEILGATWDMYDSKAHVYTVDWKLQALPYEHGCRALPGGGWACGYKRAGSCTDKRFRVPDGYDMIHLSGAWCLSRPKSRTGRLVPIIPALAAVMDRYRAATKSWPNPYNLIFRQPDGGPIDPKQDNKAFAALLEAAGLDPAQHTGHETRHSVITLLAAQGVDFQLIQEIVGHSSPQMVAHYRHAGEAERARAMASIGQPLGLTDRPV